ncbi:MAG: hypothetical protein JW955_01165 [Sedimentisphaerales bacterium]|nr:hypothetical protein [Sedimentisphaerales bacterium]
MNGLAEMVGVSEVVIRSIAKLFADRGLGEHLQMAEIYAFTMAMVSDVYTISQKGVPSTKRDLDAFHDIMATCVRLQSLGIKGEVRVDDPNLDLLVAWFLELLQMRYPDYQALFRRDIWQKHPSWFGLSSLVLKTVFADRLTDEQRESLVVPLALHLATNFVFAMKQITPE